MQSQDLLCPSSPLVDIFSFPLLAMPPFRVNDVLVGVRPSSLSSGRHMECPGSRTVVGLEGYEFPAHPCEGYWMNGHNHTERSL